MIFLTLVGLTYFITAANGRLFCGIEPVTSNWFEVFVKLDCPKLLKQHQKCCRNHGWCYVHKKVRGEACDNEYCRCVRKISRKGICKLHADNFCKIVHDMGPSMRPFMTAQNMKI